MKSKSRMEDLMKKKISKYLVSSLVVSSLVTGAMYSVTANAVQVAYFPPVPESWNVTVEGDTVVYSSPVNRKTQPTPSSIVRFTYSKRTKGKDAQNVIDDYVKNNQCKEAKNLGKGFYTASCPNISRDVVVIGEVNNMYTVEISGDYNTVSTNLINTYVNSIVNGKRTFDNRDIGEPVNNQ